MLASREDVRVSGLQASAAPGVEASGTTAPQPLALCIRAPDFASSLRTRKRAASRSVHELRRLIDEETVLAQLLSEKTLGPSKGPPATERIAHVRVKVLARRCQ